MTSLQSLFDVQGLTAVITGGSGQLGRVMAQGLAQAGVQVAVLSLHADTSEKVAEAIRTDGTRLLANGARTGKRLSTRSTLDTPPSIGESAKTN